jgi:hypothetical protein
MLIFNFGLMGCMLACLSVNFIISKISFVSAKEGYHTQNDTVKDSYSGSNPAFCQSHGFENGDGFIRFARCGENFDK